MDFLIFGIAALGLVLAKALLSKQEQDLRNKRAQRKIKQLQEDAARNASTEHCNGVEGQDASAKPPPLPTKEDS